MLNKNITFDICLLSDTCCGSGTGNGSSVDVCACFDECGLPIIPGRRLKGLLREKAYLLAENGFCTEANEAVDVADVENLFGGDGGKASKIEVYDARFKNADEISCELADKFNPKEISQAFIAERFQTAIDENGVAKERSLRTIETVLKGTEFSGVIKIKNATDSDVDIIKNSLKLLRNIGLDKSRGLGEVKCDNIQIVSEEVAAIEYEKTSDRAEYGYTITLLQDVSLMQNSPMHNPDYFSGAALQGAFAKMLSHIEGFNELFFDDALFGNAYISYDDTAYIPAPISLSAVKNDKSKAFSSADGFQKDEKKQYVPVNGYISINEKELTKKSVKRSTEHHINRKLDLLYSIVKISKGQTFKGSVFCSEGAYVALKQAVANNNGIINLGASGTAQYGKCKFEFTGKKQPEEISVGKDVVVHLISNTVILDEYANNSVAVCDLIKELKKLISFDEYDVYVKTELVGGYNAKWGMPKGQYEAFSKGSTIVLKNCQSVRVNTTNFIGINNEEGFGQILIRPVSDICEFKMSEPKQDRCNEKETENDAAMKIENKILQKRQEKRIVVSALNAAKILHSRFAGILSNSSAMRIMNLYQGLKQSDNMLEQFAKESAKSFEKNNNLKKLAEEICRSFELLNIEKQADRMFELYLRTFIGRYKELYQTVRKSEVSGNE